MQTFEEPFLSDVKHALENAFSITWEGCHKIYIMLDQESHEQMISYKYDPILVKDKNEAVSKLWEWFDNSCGLRFIQSISFPMNNENYINVIGQGEYDDDEDEYL